MFSSSRERCCLPFSIYQTMKVSTEIFETLLSTLRNLERQVSEQNEYLASKSLPTPASLAHLQQTLGTFRAEVTPLETSLRRFGDAQERQFECEKRVNKLEERQTVLENRITSLEEAIESLPELLTKLESTLGTFCQALKS